MSTQPLAFLTVKMSTKDAEKFIKSALENDIRGNNNVIVIIEPNIRPFELFPCLLEANNAYIHCPPESSRKVAAINALRDATKARNMDLTLTDARAVVEAFIVK